MESWPYICVNDGKVGGYKGGHEGYVYVLRVGRYGFLRDVDIVDSKILPPEILPSLQITLAN